MEPVSYTHLVRRKLMAVEVVGIRKDEDIVCSSEKSEVAIRQGKKLRSVLLLIHLFI